MSALRPMSLANGGLMFVFEHSALVGLGENGFDRLNQFARGLDAELYRYTRSGSGCFVDEIDIERMFERHVVRVIIRYVRLAQFEPILAAFSAALNFRLVSNHCAHATAPYDLRVFSQKANSFFQPSTACS